MKITAVLLGLLLVAGLSVAAWMVTRQQPVPATVGTADARVYFDQSAGLEDRIRALEQAVAEERSARQLLEEELQALYSEIDTLTANQEEQEAEDERLPEDAPAALAARFEAMRQSRSSTEGRTEALIEAGFTPDRAAWIVQREAELRVEAMQAQFDAQRSGEPVDRFDPSVNPSRALRQELGDYEYEKYLVANNRSTSVGVGNVLESSPGQVAGLQSGDRIVSYDGQRVFSTTDLNEQTLQGEPGESVVVDILRDGVPMQVVMPRGPIGITTRGRGPGGGPGGR